MIFSTQISMITHALYVLYLVKLPYTIGFESSFDSFRVISFGFILWSDTNILETCVPVNVYKHDFLW